MSAQVIPFVYNDKPVRTVQRAGEPWFAGKDVCGVLDIRDHNQALARLDEDERDGCSVPTPQGDQQMIIISEAGVYRLVFSSRKKEAENFKRWLAHEVLPQLRKTGKFAVEPEGPLPHHLQEEPLASLRVKIDMVKEARNLFGTGRAKALWSHLGLPDVPAASPPREIEPQQALAMLLDAGLPDTAESVRQRIERAFEDEDARMSLLPYGIRVNHEPEGFYISNRAAFIHSCFNATDYAHGRWRRVLRRLPGAHASSCRFNGDNTRATFIPSDFLDMVHIDA